MPRDLKQVRTTHAEQGLGEMSRLLYAEWVTEALAAARGAGLSREQYIPKVIRIMEDLIVDQKLEHIAEMAHTFGLTREEKDMLREELMNSMRQHFLGLRYTRKEGVKEDIEEQYSYAYGLMSGLSSAFNITYEEFAREADRAKRMLDEKRN